jgi:uncharacterized protein YceH (UPF0502 family)
MVLLLRGPQTVGELRGRTERVYRFEDLVDVETTLEEMCSIGYVKKLPRMAGRKESRYIHLLAGDVQVEADTQQPEPAALEVRAENERIAALEEEMQQLREEFVELKASFEKFKSEFE